MRGARTIVSGLVTLVLILFMTAATASGTVPVDGPVDGSSGLTSDPSFSHGRVTVEGTSLHYVRGGSGPPLVLLHGWPQTWWEWHLVMPALAHDFTVIAVDLPGLGDSAAPADGYDKATTARRVRGVVQALGYQQVALLGHDVGTLVAYSYARDYPAEVSRLAVLESPLSGFGLEDMYGLSWHFKFNMSPAPIPERIMDDSDVETYLGMMFQFSFNGAAIDRRAYYRAYSDPADRTAGYEYYRAFPADAADNQANAAAKRLTMPVLAMGGEYSFGPGVAASFSQVANDVRTAVAPAAAHFIPEENPTYLADCAKLFFGPVGQPAPRPELAACVA